ncbi:MAG: UDP-N-acetylglucosamine--N-acetylmuramyl-(pentapeptide) pyrophosphoryl-undecaprenol N-acetylglucosamine transferase, partial [Candidatus Saccharimonadales bacterium]
MTILLTGGGSGGHITPLLAVAAELRRQAPGSKIVFVGQKGDKFGGRLRGDRLIDEAEFISAGKFRRYHGQALAWLNLKDWALNIRDFFRFLAGIGQSWRLIGALSPDVVFIKGGFVGVPIGIASALKGVPFVTHDSDAIPGLANRLIARWAKVNSVALPAREYKSYSPDKVITVGIPLQAEYRMVTKTMHNAAKQAVGIDVLQRVVLLTGGGLGAVKLNDLFISITPELLERFRDLVIVHQAGEKMKEKVRADYQKRLEKTDFERIKVLGFCRRMYNYSASADVIITRAGATALAEYGIQKKACIVVPNANLTGGHQILNARLLEKRHAALVVEESRAAGGELIAAITKLLKDSNEAERLA